jgi:mannosyltransferase OCH1-like enzyme
MIPTPGKLTIIVTVTLVLMGLFAIWRGVSRDHVQLVETEHKFVQLVETEDQFPLIIHQTWQSYDVPEEFSDWVRSWQKYNPHWEYWFWSRVEIDALIRDRYPDFKKISDNFDQEIRRADSIR